MSGLCSKNGRVSFPTDDITSGSNLGLSAPPWLLAEDGGIMLLDPGWKIPEGLGMEPEQDRDLIGVLYGDIPASQL